MKTFEILEQKQSPSEKAFESAKDLSALSNNPEDYIASISDIENESNNKVKFELLRKKVLTRLEDHKKLLGDLVEADDKKVATEELNKLINPAISAITKLVYSSEKSFEELSGEIKKITTSQLSSLQNKRRLTAGWEKKLIPQSNINKASDVIRATESILSQSWIEAKDSNNFLVKIDASTQESALSTLNTTYNGKEWISKFEKTLTQGVVDIFEKKNSIVSKQSDVLSAQLMVNQADNDLFKAKSELTILQNQKATNSTDQNRLDTELAQKKNSIQELQAKLTESQETLTAKTDEYATLNSGQPWELEALKTSHNDNVDNLITTVSNYVSDVEKQYITPLSSFYIEKAKLLESEFSQQLSDADLKISGKKTIISEARAKINQFNSERDGIMATNAPDLSTLNSILENRNAEYIKMYQSIPEIQKSVFDWFWFKKQPYMLHSQLASKQDEISWTMSKTIESAYKKLNQQKVEIDTKIWLETWASSTWLFKEIYEIKNSETEITVWNPPSSRKSNKMINTRIEEIKKLKSTKDTVLRRALLNEERSLELLLEHNNDQIALVKKIILKLQEWSNKIEGTKEKLTWQKKLWDNKSTYWKSVKDQADNYVNYLWVLAWFYVSSIWETLWSWILKQYGDDLKRKKDQFEKFKITYQLLVSNMNKWSTVEQQKTNTDMGVYATALDKLDFHQRTPEDEINFENPWKVIQDWEQKKTIRIWEIPELGEKKELFEDWKYQELKTKSTEAGLAKEVYENKTSWTLFAKEAAVKKAKEAEWCNDLNYTIPEITISKEINSLTWTWNLSWTWDFLTKNILSN